ncbi:hypothetical protein [uncultured Helicobacter sp.]|uniref:hypothetical protein n=1 Tax=uncultured Helicobacter sp. TaxID=175537 RepID=UPI0027DE068C|nr:hypothetical protein [uncultured Helicobacter sp.]
MADFTPFMIQDCLNISDEIQKFCKTQNLNPSQIDFKLETYRIYLKIDSVPATQNKNQNNNTQNNQNAQNNTPNTALSEQELKQLDQDMQFNQTGFEIKQHCDVYFFPKTIQYFVHIEVSPDCDKVFLSFDDAFIFVDDPKFLLQIHNVIESQMAYHGIILRQIEQQRALVEEILQSIKQDPKKKKEKFCIKQTSVFKPLKEAYFEFLLLNKWESTYGKSPQNSAFAINIDDVIGIYHKQDSGVNGRNLKGVYIKNIPAQINQEIVQHDTQTIQIKQSASKIEYVAKIQGYVRLYEGKLFFWTNSSQPMTINNTPCLLGGIESGMTLEISTQSDHDDALGENMHIEAKEIKITGCIGRNTFLRAENVFIDGSTHQTSQIFAQSAKIFTHKGKLECNECVIKNLDSGIIKANSIKVFRSNGGRIHAKQIIVGILKTNNKIFFSQLLQIQKNEGEKNELTICIDGDKQRQQLIKDILYRIRHKKITIKALTANFKYFKQEYDRNKSFLHSLEGLSQEQKKMFLKYPKALEQLHLYQYHIGILQALKTQIILTKKYILKLEQQLIEVENHLKNAKILTLSKWNYDNYAILKTHFPKKIDRFLFSSGTIQNLGVDEERSYLKVL